MAFFVAPGGFIGGTSLGNLYVRLTADPSSFIRAMIASQQATSEAAAQMTRAVTGMAGVVSSAVIGMTAVAINEFARFNKAMTEATAIMGEVPLKTRMGLEATARSLAKELSISARDLAQAFYFLTSAGLDAEQSMRALPIVARFASAGVMNMERATSLLANAQSALGMKSKDAIENMKNMAKVADAITAANTLADATTEQFAKALTNKAGAAMRAFNVDFQEGIAVLAAFADQGIKAEEAGEAFSIILRDLQRSALNAPQIFREFGVSVFDAAGNVRSLADILRDMERVLAGTSSEQKRLVLQMMGFQDRSLSAMLSIIGTSDKIKEYTARIKEMGGVTEEVSQKQMTSLIDQATTLWHRVQDLAIQIGKELEPVLREWIDRLKELMDEISNFEERTGALAAAAMTVIDVFKAMIVGFMTVWTVLRSIATIIADTLVSLWTVMKPLGMFLVDILKRLGIAIYEAAKSFEFLFKSIQSLIKFNLSEAQRNLEIFKDRFLGAFSDAWQGVKQDSRKNWEDLKEGWNQMLKTFPEMAKMTLGDLAQQWEQYADRVLKLFPSFEERQKKTEALMNTTKKQLQGVAQAAEEVSKAVDKASESFQRMSVQAVINSRKVEALLNLLGVPKMSQRPVAPNLRELMERITFESGGNVNTEEAAEMLRAANIPVGGMTRGASALELLGPEVFRIRQFQEEIEQTKAKLDILRQLGEQEVELTEEIQKRKEEAIKAYNERLKELTLAQSVLLIKQYESAFGELANALEWFADEQVGIYEAMFAVSKAFALADAIIKIQQGIAQALVLPFPANLAAMAQIISATASIVSTIQSVTMTIAGERAMGGPVQRNRTYLVGERGPELFTPSQSGFIIPNDRLAMGGSVQVIVNNFTDAQAEVRERQIGEKRVIEVMIKRLKQELSSDIRDGRGDFVRAIESTYRLRR